MSKFVLEEIEELEGKQRFYKLIVNGRCGLDSFWEKYSRDKLYRKELIVIQTRLNMLAELKHNYLDLTKFRELKRNKRSDLYKDYEVKTRHLRLYFFRDEARGMIIVLGGSKKEQKSDISKMRSIKLAYFNANNKLLCIRKKNL